MNTGMEHDEIAELLGAYALGALDADERARVDDLLDRSPEARSELARYEHALVALTDAEATAPLPHGGWDRVRTAMHDEAADDDHRDDHGHDDDGSTVAPVVELPILRLPRRERARRGPVVLAAAAANVAAGLAVALVVQRQGGGGSLQDAADAALTDGSSRIGRLAGDGVSIRAVIDTRGNGYLFAADLPALPEGRIYQLWSLDGPAPVSLGVLGNRPGLVAFPTGGQVRTLALSTEASPGVTAPTNPIASGALA